LLLTWKSVRPQPLTSRASPVNTFDLSSSRYDTQPFEGEDVKIDNSVKQGPNKLTQNCHNGVIVQIMAPSGYIRTSV